jgi:transcription initiation factor TFIID subunit 7
MSKPQIKLKMSSASFGSQNKNPTVGTPTSGGGPKLKLNIGGSKPSTPSSPSEIVVTPKIQKTKAGRAPKPSAKVVANKNGGKRVKEESDDEDYRRTQTGSARPFKKIKLNLGPKTPTVLKAKFKGRPPRRPPGEGYDSEASDREQDPVIEEEFILRMVPGEDCDYLRRMIEERKIGIARKEGGADVQMKFIHPEGRRAAVTVRGRHYAATLVDLPCIIEGMKSWDKKGWYKSADICQMLYVFQRIPEEADAGTVELPKLVDPETFQFPHGLTPPMYYARKRRFRKRISRTAIEAVEDAVEKLLEADANAESTRYEMIEPEAGSRQGSQGYDTASPDNNYGNDGEKYSEGEDQDAEGEVEEPDGYFSHMNSNGAGQPKVAEAEEDDLAADLEADLEAAFEAELDSGTPMSQVVGGTPDVMLTNGGTPEANGQVGEDSGDDSSDGGDDEDADGDENDIDEDERARLAELQGAKEDIADMERQLEHLQNQMTTQVNPILKRRIKDNMEKVKAELQLKKSAIGEGDED